MNDEAFALLARIQGGDKIGAIKRVRELTGSTLSEAKDAIESIQTLADAERILEVVENTPRAPSANQHGIDIEIRKLALSGQRIAAIKMLRERNRMGLKEAKDALDLAVPPPAGHSLPWPLFAAIAGAVALYFLYVEVT